MRTIPTCKDCSSEIYVNTNMVMLSDEIWKLVSDHKDDYICSCCIETRLGRKISESDFECQGIPLMNFVFGILKTIK